MSGVWLPSAPFMGTSCGGMQVFLVSVAKTMKSSVAVFKSMGNFGGEPGALECAQLSVNTGYGLKQQY